jgi:uncharacterized membrane protein
MKKIIVSLKLSILSILATLAFNFFALSDFNFLYLSTIYTFLYLCLFPGYLIKRLFKLERLTTFEALSFNAAFSIAFLLLVGISTNSLSLLGVSHPLTKINSLMVFNLFTGLLLIANYFLKVKDDFSAKLSLSKLNYTHLPFYIIPALFPIVSILGARLLDNSGSNILTMILLGSIATYTMLVTVFSKLLKKFSFEIPIFLIAISLLFMFSLRSPYIIGWDIYQEFKVFTLTLTNQLWSMQNYEDPYNACLSITILPTLFHYFTKLNEPYVFKVLYQLLFALVPVTLFSLAKKYSTPLIAFISTFFFMSTLNFFLEMPALLRQEIAYLFFSLLLLTLFNKNIKALKRRIIFTILCIAIALSHYSTAYILIGLFSFSVVLLSLYKKFIKKPNPFVRESFGIDPFSVIIFIVFTFLWLGIVTKTSGNIMYTIENTVSNINNSAQRTFNTTILDQLVFFPSVPNEQMLLQQTIDDTKKDFANNKFTFYSDTTSKTYTPVITHNDILPKSFSDEISGVTTFIGNSITKAMKLFILLGFAGVFVLWRKKVLPLEYTVLTAGFASALLLITSIPAISLFYPIGRLDQQILMLISVTTVLSLSWILRFIPYMIRMALIAFIFVIYFLYSTTFIPQVVGDKDPEIVLNNAGRYYNEIYMHKSEFASIHWLYANDKNNTPVFADLGSTEKIKAYGGNGYTYTYSYVFPSLLDKDGYVYSNYANTLHDTGVIDIKVDRMEFNYPTDFLENNKNVIYSNGETKIYK